MSRWDQLADSGGSYVTYESAPYQATYPATQYDSTRVANAAKVGELFATRPDAGGRSDFVQCLYYQSDTIICEKDPGCCRTTCCPKDWLMMGGLYVLIAFVIIIVVASILVAIVCYNRTKSQQKKEQLPPPGAYYAPSQYGGGSVVNGAYPGTYGYTPYMAESTKY